MKKIANILSFIAIALLITLVIYGYCCMDNNAHAIRNNEYGYTIIDNFGTSKIVYMNKTKVMYAISDGHRNRGTFTLLVNPDGTPMIYEGE